MSALEIQEHRFGGALWIAVRARGSDWLWLKPEEAVDLGQQLIAAFANEDADKAK